MWQVIFWILVVTVAFGPLAVSFNLEKKNRKFILEFYQQKAERFIADNAYRSRWFFVVAMLLTVSAMLAGFGKPLLEDLPETAKAQAFMKKTFTLSESQKAAWWEVLSNGHKELQPKPVTPKMSPVEVGVVHDEPPPKKYPSWWHCIIAIFSWIFAVMYMVGSSAGRVLSSIGSDVKIPRKEKDKVHHYSSVVQPQPQELSVAGMRVASIGRRLQSITGTSYPVVIKEGKEVNAFANGSEVIVMSALETCLDDGELAYVIAHEIGHNLREHPRLLGLRYEVGAEVFDRDVVVGVLTFLANRWIDRKFEEVADRFAVDLMVRAGYNPNKAISALQKFDRRGVRIGIISTHPTPQNRIERVKKRSKGV